MNITELVKSINTPYYETVASRLPRGIKSQQHLLNLGYVITVQDLGLSRAKALDESFAANLVKSYHKQCLNEGVGSFLGKAAGHVVGGLGAAWRDAKKGYADAKASWADKTAPAAGAAPAAGGTAPVSGTTAVPPPDSGSAEPAPAAPSTYATPPAGGDTGRPYVAQPGAGAAPEAPAASGGSAPAPTAPAAGGTAPAGDIGSIMQAIDKLDPPSKQKLAADLEKNIKDQKVAAASTPNAGDEPTTPEERAAHVAAGGKFDLKTGQPIPLDNKAPAAGGEAPAGPAGGATPPAGGATPPTAPAGEPPAPGATPTAPATTTPPAGDKLTQAQQDAMKARLQGQRAAGKTTASQTGSGFKDYVGGSEQKMAGVDASGAPVFKKLQRESVAFSKFLGVHI
jgi:hypothetical protein